MQQITAEFVYTQLRIVLIGGVSYAAGKGWFTPTDATFAGVVITSILPLLVPWFFSTYVSWGTTKVPLNSVAAQVAVTEQRIAAAIGDPQSLTPTPQQVTAALSQTVTQAVKDKLP